MNIKRFLWVWLAIAALAGGGWLVIHHHFSEQEIVKSPQDDRDYLAFTLKNKMKVVVVSDQEAHKAAATLTVKRGSFNDPDDFPGLAHFCEHMLFLGTKKHPEPEGFSKFIQSHGGQYNAFTANEETTYHYSVQPEALADSIDRFADFFVAPLFEQKWVAREINAVDSEFKMYLNEDSWGMMDVGKATSNPKHPYSRFAVGNLETLAKDQEKLYQAVKKFYQDNYDPEQMALVIVGPQSTQELAALAKKHFCAVTKKSNEKPTTLDMPLYTKAELGCDIHMKCKGEHREMTLMFPLPKPHVNDKTAHILSSLLADEGEGSLTEYLKNKQWIYSLQAGHMPITNAENAMTMVFSLTPEGYEKIDEVTASTFAYIRLLKDKGMPDYYVDDLKKISMQAFLTEERSQPESLAMGLARSVHETPLKDLLTHNYLMPKDHINPKRYRALLTQLQPQNMRRFIVSHLESSDTKTKWFHVPYYMAPLSDAQINAWEQGASEITFALPKKNVYIAEKLDLKPKPKVTHKLPTKITHEEVTLWHHQDTTFGLPKADIQILLQTKKPLSPESAVMAKLFSYGISMDFSTRFYAAGMAGHGFSVNPHLSGITLSLNGYNDKQDKLMVDLLQQLQSYQIDRQTFELVKKAFSDELLNYRQEALYTQAMTELGILLSRHSWHPETLINVCDTITLEGLNAYIAQHWENTQAEVLVHGNYTQGEANVLALLVADNLPKVSCRKELLNHLQFSKLGDRTFWQHRFHSPDQNHVSAWYMQNEKDDDATYAKTVLLAKLLENPFFKQLRTEKQLGYALGASPVLLNKSSGLLCWVQSPHLSADQITNEMQQFIKSFNANIGELSDEDLAQYKESVSFDLDRPPQSLHEQTDKWWAAIESGEYDFDRQQKIKAAIQLVSVTDMLQFTNKVLSSPVTVGQIIITADPVLNNAAIEHDSSQQIANFKQKVGYFEQSKSERSL